jgi:deoxyribose-phosphate aldolase
MQTSGTGPTEGCNDSDMNLASYIDHTLLTAEVTGDQVKRLCSEAREYGFANVTVNPRWVPLASDILLRSEVKVGSVVGFPLGAESTTIKTAQATELIFAGADEVDMVADISAIVELDRDYFLNDLNSVLKACRSMRPAVVLKVIIESAALTDEQKVFACEICQRAGVDFIKTSTGLNPAGGASAEDVKLMAQTAPGCRIKAAGGIRTASQALAMIEAGASRIGTSASIQIIEEFRKGGTGEPGQ